MMILFMILAFTLIVGSALILLRSTAIPKIPKNLNTTTWEDEAD